MKLNWSSVCALALASALTPQESEACGGVFCNPGPASISTINQAGERILFAQDPEDPSLMHMHVQIQYQGEPDDFGWILPVPPDVEVQLGVDALFAALDGASAPGFALQAINRCSSGDTGSSGCGDQTAVLRGSGVDGSWGAPEYPSVDVLSQGQIGPYEQVVLTAEDVGEIVEWLELNDFNVPDGSEALLMPYLEEGSVFLALRLRSEQEVGDIEPIHLTFTSDTPGIPLRPTAVAAEPDMGIIVHVLGDHRAVPLNYQHVIVNDALIDWENGGRNYADAVSHAVDAAEGGLGFVTDSAQALQPNQILGQIPGMRIAEPAQTVADLRRLSTFRDWQALFLPPSGSLFDSGTLSQSDHAFWCEMDSLSIYEAIPELRALTLMQFQPPAAVPAAVHPQWDEWLFCPWRLSEVPWGPEVLDAPIDGEPLAIEIEERIAPRYTHLERLFARWRYLTRLYTTLSPEEMVRDPIFGFNEVLPDVPPVRTAFRLMYCDRDVIETPSGLEYSPRNRADTSQVERDRGITVRGEDEIGAMQVQQLLPQGPPMLVVNNQLELGIRHRVKDGEQEEGGCQTGQMPGGLLLWMLPLIALPLRRRR